ncbi:uncharacterized protein B0I36DRAFT_356349 [Microdochium trichocladiopsis]|uniref:Uncharacterized protein n=1 Tax=Microdochium trichocladiopsis TaxID=1682393 RepID=A0A9P8XQU7_9PEZI|nr:uncharacterized protein B0I36DRAFT_356349 [Microdochium trichocladiopsis]KAH7012278.1 hypothetical protein B0I36DRAFT_356349 [Microdochium trichocladiopsis]
MPEKKHRDLQGPDASPADEGTRFIAAIDQAKRLQQHPLDPQDVEYGTFLATRMVLPSFRMLQSQRLDIETLGKTVPDETDQTTGALVIPWLDGDDWILFHVDKDTGAAYMFDPTPRREPSRVVAFFRQAYTDAGYGSITAMWRVPAGTRTDKWSSGWWVVEKVLMLVTGRDIKSIGFAVVKSEDVPYETDFAKTTDMIADFLQMRYVREPDQSGNRVVSVQVGSDRIAYGPQVPHCAASYLEVLNLYATYQHRPGAETNPTSQQPLSHGFTLCCSPPAWPLENLAVIVPSDQSKGSSTTT